MIINLNSGLFVFREPQHLQHASCVGSRAPTKSASDSLLVRHDHARLVHQVVLHSGRNLSVSKGQCVDTIIQQEPLVIEGAQSTFLSLET